MIIDLDIASFRINFPAYASEADYPDMRLNSQYAIGKCFIADNDCTLPEECREYALQLMLAHLLSIQDSIASGRPTQIVTSASEGSVSVSLAEPPNSDTWTYWFSTTPYGLQLITMLDASSVGGFFIGGSEERRGFRKINGGF
jgi:hypothetical protein